MEERHDFATCLRIFRKARGLKQRELAAKIGVTNKAISKWEKGNSEPKFTLLPTIASTLGVSIDDLMGYSGSH